MKSATAIKAQVETALASRIAAPFAQKVCSSPELIPTRIPSIDLLLKGGMPRGQLTEVVGSSSAGRTGLAFAAIASATSKGAACAWIDVQDAFDPESAAAWGIDLQRLLWLRAGEKTPLLARGELNHLLVPLNTEYESDFTEHISLDHPVDFIQPLFLFLARMMSHLVIRTTARVLAVSTVIIRFQYATTTSSELPLYLRSIKSAVPTQNCGALLKLIQLDIEAHPPCAPVQAITIKAIPAPLRTVQHEMFQPWSPEPGRLDVLLARLRKLCGDDSVGSPELINTHRSEGFKLSAFKLFCTEPGPINTRLPDDSWPTVFRVCRPPRAIRVSTISNKPSAVMLDGERFLVETLAGPWRRNGEWWSHTNWCREEWDVVLTIERTQHCIAKVCRIAHDPSSQCWYLEGIYD